MQKKDFLPLLVGLLTLTACSPQANINSAKPEATITPIPLSTKALVETVESFKELNYAEALSIANSSDLTSSSFSISEIPLNEVITRAQGFLNSIKDKPSGERQKIIYVNQRMDFPITIYSPQLIDAGTNTLNSTKKSDPNYIQKVTRLIPLPRPTEIDANAVDVFVKEFPSVLAEYNKQNPNSTGQIQTRKRIDLFILPFGSIDPVIPNSQAFFFGSGQTQVVIVTPPNISAILSTGTVIAQANHLFTDFVPKNPDAIEYHLLQAGPYIEMAQALTTETNMSPEKQQQTENRNNSIGLFYYALSINAQYDKYEELVNEANNMPNKLSVPEPITEYLFSQEVYTKFLSKDIKPFVHIR